MSFQLGHKVEHTQHVHIPGRGGRLGCTSQGDFHSHTRQGGGGGYLLLGVGTLWLEGGMENRERTPGGAQNSLLNTFAMKGPIHKFIIF